MEERKQIHCGLNGQLGGTEQEMRRGGKSHKKAPEGKKGVPRNGKVALKMKGEGGQGKEKDMCRQTNSRGAKMTHWDLRKKGRPVWGHNRKKQRTKVKESCGGRIILCGGE